MVDIVSPVVRSRMMSGIGSKNTKPEVLIRKALFGHGYRYRLHDKSVKGKPDLVLKKYRAVIFVNGCFWHGHDCHLFKWPKTREEFWRNKIEGNRERDINVVEDLLSAGWRVLLVRECSIKGKEKISLEAIIERIKTWLESDKNQDEIRGESTVTSDDTIN